MAQSNGFFGTISGIDRDAHGGIIVTLDTDVSVLVPFRFLEVLQALHELRIPVYFEAGELLDAVRVRIPDVVHVKAVDGNEATFVESAVRAQAADKEILTKLRQAAATGESVAVTITDDFVVIDVRPYSTPAPEDVAENPPVPEIICISQRRARELFELCAVTSCNPVKAVPPPPCIPFRYPKDGCWARASAMTRIMIAAGVTPLKLWIDGRLKTMTKNSPTCFVQWSWHVAPLLCVRVSRWLPLGTEQVVIDPSLFTRPVSPAEWKGVMGDPAATFETTSSNVFLRSVGGVELDPTYAKTERALKKFRVALQTLSLGPDGPPPYKCP